MCDTNEMTEKLARVSKERDELKAKHDAQVAWSEDLMQRYDALKAERDDIKEALDCVVEDRDNIQKKCDDYWSDCASLTVVLADASEERDKLRQCLQKVEIDRLGQHERADKLQDELDRLTNPGPEEPPTRSDILDMAKRCVVGDREQDYGSPEQNFERIAEMWEAYMVGKCTSADVCILPEDVAAMLALLKIARIASGHAKADNWVDLAGYAACGGEIEGRK